MFLIFVLRNLARDGEVARPVSWFLTVSYGGLYSKRKDSLGMRLVRKSVFVILQCLFEIRVPPFVFYDVS